MVIINNKLFFIGFEFKIQADCIGLFQFGLFDCFLNYAEKSGFLLLFFGLVRLLYILLLFACLNQFTNMDILYISDCNSQNSIGYVEK